METTTASPEGQTPVSTSAPSTPATSAFTDSTTPNWVKDAGLQAAHDKGSKPAATTPAPAVIPGQVTPAITQPPTGTSTPSTVVPPVAPAPLTIDHAALAKAIREGNQPVPAGPSDEDVSRQLGIVSMSPELYKSIYGVDGTPEQIQARNNYDQSLAKQAVTISTILFQRELQQLREQFQPHMEVIQRQERDRIKSEFFKQHADLAGYEAHVTQQYQLLAASGRKFTSLKEASDFVAEQSRSSLKALGITPNAPTPANGPTTPSRTASQSRTMTPASVGGKGGGASPAAQSKTAGQQVWD